jgi:hypothetical protein
MWKRSVLREHLAVGPFRRRVVSKLSLALRERIVSRGPQRVRTGLEGELTYLPGPALAEGAVMHSRRRPALW